MRGGGVAVALGVILAGNAGVLVRVAGNRSSGPQNIIELSERELPLAPLDEENTGLFLRLRWQNLPARFRHKFEEGPGWFDQAKLEEAGFDCRLPPADPAAETRYRHVAPREAWVVLEYRPESSDGAGLLPVDVGKDLSSLRSRYPEAKRFVIVRGVLGLVHERPRDPPAVRPPAPAYLRGAILQVFVHQIHVPLPHRRVFDALRKQPAPRYTVTLAFGARQEPWIVDCRRRP